jgi:hypothetical protein
MNQARIHEKYMRNTMTAPTLADIAAKYGVGQPISLEQLARDFCVDDFTAYEVMAVRHEDFSPDWTPRLVNDNVWTIEPTRDIVNKALSVVANGSWTTWQTLRRMPMENPCGIFIETAVVMAAQPEGFRATDGTVYRASAEPPNRIKVWKE